ncbi:pentamidine resistance factor [Thoreauomyces humboldtii]|nr:pentamidine resistance factor [Thoreauomyces humboldtii]
MALAVASLLLHAGFLIYGHFQDQHPVVKFTDVDYLVFTDGARFVTAGESPYLRATYRYTPLLAWLVVPNVVWHPDFGKWLFCACDLLGGWFIHAILCRVGCAPDRATKYTAVWLLNPFVVAISARGNSESVITVLVLGALWALMTGRQNLGGILYGISVHFKIYPIVYALPFWLYLDSNYPCKSASLLREYSGGNGGTSTAGRAPLLGVRKGLGEFFSWRRLQFAILSGGVFLLLTAGMYYL